MAIWPFEPHNVAYDNCSGEDVDRWDVIYENVNAGKWYQVLRNVANGLCLDLENGSSANGTRIQTNLCDYTFTKSSQQWALGENLPYAGGAIVPNVLTWDKTSAVNAVTGAGLTPVVKNVNDCYSPGDIENQSPFGGYTMSPGSVVRLTVSTCTGGGGGGIPD